MVIRLFFEAIGFAFHMLFDFIEGLGRMFSGEDTSGLGVDLETGRRFGFTWKDLLRHCYILGRTGSGKTSLILQMLEADVRAAHSVVVVDLRGDLVSGVLAMCERLKVGPGRITLIDLREESGGHGFDPLSGAGAPYVHALHLLEVVSNERTNWGVRIEETMRCAHMLLSAAKKPLTCIESVFFDEQFRNACMECVQDEAVVGFWTRFALFSPAKQQEYALAVLNKLTPLLAVPPLRNVLGSDTPIDLGKELANRGRIILVSLAVDELQRSGRMFGNLVVSAIAREMMARVRVPEKDRNPVRMYVDEFENMASEAFEGLIAEGRRFKLSLVLSHQTLAQLPSKLRSVVRNNVGVQILFQCGFEDAQALNREIQSEDDDEDGDLRALEVGEAYVVAGDGTVKSVRFDAPNESQNVPVSDQYRALVLDRRRRSSAQETAPDSDSQGSSQVDLDEWL
ncbi:MAG: type IV secretion system DNA-binding domain-containing protein [Armatimonadetes bacterium]|nr:type IV secretion system DNA-binding domain-containing protein [Armatimonadota bacterium]